MLLGRSRRELAESIRDASLRNGPSGRPSEQARRQAEIEGASGPAAGRGAKTTPAEQKEAEDHARQQKEAEDYARRQKEAEDHARQLGEEQARRVEEEAARRLRKEQRRRDTHQMLRSMRQRAARLLSRRWVVVVLAVSVGIGGALLLLIYVLRTPPIMGQLPADLRASCSAKGTSATCRSARRDRRLLPPVRYGRSSPCGRRERERAGTERHSLSAIRPRRDPIVCSYAVGAETGVAAFSQTVKPPEQFYGVRWNPAAHPQAERRDVYDSNATAQDWESLRSNWTRLAGMH